MKRYSFFFIIFILFFFSVQGSDDDDDDDTSTMIALSKNLPLSSNNKSYWNTSNKNPCMWEGVNCSSNSSTSHPRVISLSLSNIGLTSSLPLFKLLCNLTSLQRLDLSMNSLSFVPQSFFFSNCTGLSQLTELDLSSNRFNSSLSSFLRVPSFQLKNLKHLNLRKNSLSGPIPARITNNLTYLDLSYNHLNGKIPSDFFSSKSLQFLDLSYNQLEGTVPGNVSASLNRLRLAGNNLSGDITQLFDQPSNLNYLELENNQFDGEIPSQLRNCRKLQLLNLAVNQLQGSLSKELGDLDQIVILQLQENHLSGEIPPEVSKLVSLNTLNLSHNSLNGPIPPEISSLQKLAFLHLEGNKLSGQIPNTITNLSGLIELQLGHNNLSGMIPMFPANLNSLNLSNNLFSGPIPLYLGYLEQLEILDLSRNNFTGTVPSSLANMPSLTLLVLSYNQLSGTLPHFPHFVTVDTTGNFVNSASAPPPPAPPAPPAAQRKRRKPSGLIIIVSIISAIVGVSLLTAILLLAVSKRFCRVEDEGLQLQLEDSTPQIVSVRFLTSDSNHRSNIDFARTMEVVSSPSNVMLKTRFSTYFKANMPTGTNYTVKKLNWSDKIFPAGSNERFGQELKVLGRLSNSNIMAPLAYVLTEDSAFLFYEHVHKGTVYDSLHEGSENVLGWQSRYSIALGVAQGLTFLHGCIEPVLLLDLSTKSVHLKSKNNEPQIGDIELCKVIDPSKSAGSLSTVAGSVGYIPPEYAYTMRVTAAANVYSFGVILLELLTGKPPVYEGIELAKWALSFAARPEQRQEILDSRVSKASVAVQRQMLSVLKVALSCVSLSPEARPKMRNVLRMLFNAR